MANTVTLIPMVKNVNSLMSVDFRAISPVKNLMKTSNRKIPSILMTGSELQLPFNFLTMKFPTLPGPDREFLKPRDLLHLNSLKEPPNPNGPPSPSVHPNLNNNSTISNSPSVHPNLNDPNRPDPNCNNSPNNNSTISNSNPNVLLLPSGIPVCLIGPPFNLPNNNNKLLLCKTF